MLLLELVEYAAFEGGDRNREAFALPLPDGQIDGIGDGRRGGQVQPQPRSLAAGLDHGVAEVHGRAILIVRVEVAGFDFGVQVSAKPLDVRGRPISVGIVGLGLAVQIGVCTQLRMTDKWPHCRVSLYVDAYSRHSIAASLNGVFYFCAPPDYA